jgi:hypothetical protein
MSFDRFIEYMPANWPDLLIPAEAFAISVTPIRRPLGIKGASTAAELPIRTLGFRHKDTHPAPVNQDRRTTQ